MNDLTRITNWLDDPKRDFAQGIILFNRYKVNNKMDEFFRNNASKPSSAVMSLLIEKLNAIKLRLVANPKLFIDSIVKESTRKPFGSKLETPKVKPKNVATPSPAAVPVVDFSSLPRNLAKDYERIKEIVPLLGGLKAKLNACNNNAEAKVICEQIVSLDTEKRTLWAGIDEFNGKTSEERNKILSPNFERIEALNKKLKVTKDSLTRKMKVVEEHKKHRKHLVPKGLKKIEEYEKTIEKLEKEIKELS